MDTVDEIEFLIRRFTFEGTNNFTDKNPLDVMDDQ